MVRIWNYKLIMEFKWKTIFYTTKLFDGNNKLIGSFNLSERKTIKLGEYEISSNGFYTYYIKDNNSSIIHVNIDPMAQSLTLDSDKYSFTNESRSHSYLHVGKTVVASCYTENGLFNPKGAFTFQENFKHKLILAYCLLVLRQVVKNRGGE